MRLWDNAWAEFVPFLAFDPEIGRVICSTNAIESVNARIRRAVKARGHFPNEQAALKCVYLAILSLDPTGTARKRRTITSPRWSCKYAMVTIVRASVTVSFPGPTLGLTSSSLRSAEGWRSRCT
ncbi:Probable transposase for the insertion element IS2606 [Amycolatopsis camponoti]|uniref:Mutator family transposase n=1 Tax=Amycolatopsis camponoti TaxID=2606593 RepID=A0A6I8LKY0_9PSEU|nr:Probable transposase for the insertion element IS2606 [Amycolatopsis camponoti]